MPDHRHYHQHVDRERRIHQVLELLADHWGIRPREGSAAATQAYTGAQAIVDRLDREHAA